MSGKRLLRRKLDQTTVWQDPQVVTQLYTEEVNFTLRSMIGSIYMKRTSGGKGLWSMHI